MDFLLKLLNSTEATTIKLPLKEIVNAVYDIDFVPRAIKSKLTVVESYGETYGKVPSAMGNTAILDCNYLNQTFLATFDTLFEQITDEQPLYFLFLQPARKAVI